MDSTLVIAVAGLIGTGSGAVLSYRAGLATAKEETRRLERQHFEEERRNRQGTYHQLLTLVNEILWAEQDELEALIARWHFVTAGVALFGAAEVVPRVRSLSQTIASGTNTASDEWRERVITGAREVTTAMRADVGSEALRASTR